MENQINNTVAFCYWQWKDILYVKKLDILLVVHRKTFSYTNQGKNAMETEYKKTFG